MPVSENDQSSVQASSSQPWFIDSEDPTCPECGDTFDTEVGVRNHYTRLHNEPYPWWKKKTCRYCGDAFRRPNSRNKDIYCSKNCAGKDNAERINYVPFILEDHHGYPRWRPSNANPVSVHQLLAISEGADPYKVFGNSKYNIHHKNGMKADNRLSNIELADSSVHGRKDGAKNGWFYSHEDMLLVFEFFTPLGELPPLKTGFESEDP
jgi:hypothetical protein